MFSNTSHASRSSRHSSAPMPPHHSLDDDGTLPLPLPQLFSRPFLSTQMSSNSCLNFRQRFPSHLGKLQLPHASSCRHASNECLNFHRALSLQQSLTFGLIQRECTRSGNKSTRGQRDKLELFGQVLAVAFREFRALAKGQCKTRLAPGVEPREPGFGDTATGRNVQHLELRGTRSQDREGLVGHAGTMPSGQGREGRTRVGEGLYADISQVWTATNVEPDEWTGFAKSREVVIRGLSTSG